MALMDVNRGANINKKRLEYLFSTAGNFLYVIDDDSVVLGYDNKAIMSKNLLKVLKLFQS